MKLKAGKRELKSNYNHIVKICYCNAQHLLKYVDPFSYCTRSEGWACDNYDIDGVLISTGYSPIDSRNTKSDYHMIREYDDRALKICCSDLSHNEKKIKINKILKEFIERVKVVT
jgi:hypothetical protein